MDGSDDFTKLQTATCLLCGVMGNNLLHIVIACCRCSLDHQRPVTQPLPQSAKRFAKLRTLCLIIGWSALCGKNGLRSLCRPQPGCTPLQLARRVMAAMEKRQSSADSAMSTETEAHEASEPSEPIQIPGSSQGSASSATPFSQTTYPDFPPHAVVPLLKPTGGAYSITCVFCLVSCSITKPTSQSASSALVQILQDEESDVAETDQDMHGHWVEHVLVFNNMLRGLQM